MRINSCEVFESSSQGQTTTARVQCALQQSLSKLNQEGST